MHRIRLALAATIALALAMPAVGLAELRRALRDRVLGA
jgi:hypothetical protein